MIDMLGQHTRAERRQNCGDDTNFSNHGKFTAQSSAFHDGASEEVELLHQLCHHKRPGEIQ